MMTTDKNGIDEFIESCVSHGMRKFVCSPGSRNAPLILAIDNHPDIDSIVIHDERSAAFYALGMALVLDSPVGIVCTSGSAMLNYYPAVAEAYYQCIPLVVITADRPSEWINHGDGQTIVQNGVYENHIRYELHLEEYLKSDASLKKMNSEVEKAFAACNGKWKGPIHVNVPISEPLYNTTNKRIRIPANINSQISEKSSLRFDEEFQEIWMNSQRIMILCGQMKKDILLNQRLDELSKDKAIVILNENTSNLSSDNFIQCIDRTLSGIQESELGNLRPELLITLGGAVISKRIKSFLRESEIKNHWKVGHSFPKMDTYRCLSQSFECETSDFLDKLLERTAAAGESNFRELWQQKSHKAEELTNAFVEKAVYSDLSVFNAIIQNLPKEINLHMGNSSVVRYCQLFEPNNSITYFANRGTSGIDGCTSTACGVSLVASNKMNVLLSGDVSFFYDNNALWSNYLSKNLRIILINNNGGGIFKIIDRSSGDNLLDKYFVAPHNRSAEHICLAHNVKYSKSTSSEGLIAKLKELFSEDPGNRPKLLEIFTPSDSNHLLLDEFFKAAASS